MLELKDVSFRVDDEKDKEKDILEHVSFTLEDNMLPLQVLMGAESPLWQRSSPVS